MYDNKVRYMINYAKLVFAGFICNIKATFYEGAYVLSGNELNMDKYEYFEKEETKTLNYRTMMAERRMEYGTF